MSNLDCRFDGCDRPHRARGLCKGHYAQANRGRPLKALPVVCVTDGCERTSYTVGLCRSCYARQRRADGYAPTTRNPKLPDGWYGPAPKKEWAQRPPTAAGVQDMPYVPPLDAGLIRSMAITLIAAGADDLLDMLLPDDWRTTIAQHRTKAA